MKSPFNKTIYTFWEPKDRITPYIKLCMEKWDAHLDGFHLVLLDYSNLFDHIPEDSLDLEKIKQFSLALQKDIIEATVLRFNGGIFLDADVILVQNISPLVEKIESYEVVIFNSHIACIVARPGARLIIEWYEKIIEKLNASLQNAPVRWDYFGNSIINSKLKRKEYNVFRIDKVKTGFTPELNYYCHLNSPEKRYAAFWFSETLSAELILYQNQSIIALHNSWTPLWYKKLSREEVLAHPSLLSRFLREGNSATNKFRASKVTKMSALRIKTLARLHSIISRIRRLLTN